MTKIKVRVILGVLTFAMFFIYQMSRFNINIAIVAITHAENNSNVTSTQFDAKSIILGSFFWMSWMTELTGAYLVGKFGCRYVMTIAFLINAVACFLFPFAYQLHPLCSAVVRIFQGLALGTTLPTMACLTQKWIPKNERSRFMSSYHGSSFGASITNLVGGVVIDKLGWQYIFHGTGILTLLWVLCWLSFAYDSPFEHPRISAEEREYLAKHVEGQRQDTGTAKQKSQPTPWRHILVSKPFWAMFVIFMAMMSYNITLAMQIPTYFDSVHMLDIKMNGLLVSLPDFCKMIVGIKFPMIIENFTKKDKITVKTARRLSISIGLIIPGLLIIILAFFGNQSVAVAASLIILSVTINGCGSSSILANVVDISPNHSGTIMGVLKTFSNIPGILSPILVKFMLADNPNNWTPVFLFIGTFVIFSCIFYLIFGSTEAQYWDKKLELPESVDLMEIKEKSVEKNDINCFNVEECKQ